MAKAPIPPINEPVLDDKGLLAKAWQFWHNTKHKQAGGQAGLDIFPLFHLETTIAASTLDSAGTHTILSVDTAGSYKVREIMLTGDGTNFGAGGDRGISIQDSSGTIIWTIIPNATIESLAAARWGDTEVAYPTTASDLFAASTVGEDLVAVYSGGATDHSGTGSLTISLVLEKIT